MVLKWGASSRWLFRPNFTCCSIETRTIGKTHPTLSATKLLLIYLNLVLHVFNKLFGSCFNRFLFFEYPDQCFVKHPILGIRIFSSAENIIKWGVSSRWSSSLYCPMRNSGQMTIGRTHPTL